MSDETAAKPPLTPSQQQRADWAYGNTKLSNPDVTREMAEDAVRKKDAAKPIDAETLNVVGRLLGMTPPYPGHPDDMEWGTTSLTVGKFRAIAAELAAAKAERDQWHAQADENARLCGEAIRDGQRRESETEIRLHGRIKALELTVAQWQEGQRKAYADFTSASERATNLEAALAKVPHLMKGNSGPDSRFIIKEPNALHDRERCAAYGGRCAALASPSEPAGGRKE